MITSYDRKGYEKLNAPQEVASSFSTKQARQRIVKTLLLTQGEERRVGILKASDSELLFEKEGGSKGLVEEMENVELIYQEELEEGTQLIARLIAKKALYDYEKERLIAEDADLTRYRLLGHQFPEMADLKDPIFSAFAKDIHLEFQENRLKAAQLKGSFPSSFAAQEASFENGELLIGGDFHFEHPLGTLQAKSAKARFGEITELPKEILMEEGATLHLKDGSKISSPYSRLDTSSWVAFFHGLEGNKVALEGPNHSLKSLEMTLHFSPPSQVDRLIAEGEVEIGLQDGLKLQGHHAHFHSFTPEGRFSKAILKEECLLTKEETEIHAEEIAADFDLDQATLTTAYGTLQNLKFDAKGVLIDKQKGKMFLDPPIHLEWGGILDTTGRVEVTEENQKLDLLYIEGPSVFKMKDEKGLEHTLKTWGTILIDPKAKIASISSDGKQIHFSDSYGDIYADHVQVYFEEVDGKLKPSKLSLEGNIRLQNIQAGLQRYALAENADYDVMKGELILKSNRPARVLFYDLANKMQASAPALILKRNPETKKDEIKGIGNVRFLLSEEEWNELKKRFSFE